MWCGVFDVVYMLGCGVVCVYVCVCVCVCVVWCGVVVCDVV